MKNLCRKINNFIFFPVRCLFPNNEYIGFLNVTPLSQERFDTVKPYLKGNVLDFGCGDNRLIREYRENGGDGIGIDLPHNDLADIKLNVGEDIPFKDGHFDTIVMTAVLNHITDRERVLKECHRCLAPCGMIIITMLGPLVGRIGHFLWRLFGSDIDLKYRQHKEGELMGMSQRTVKQLLVNAGFIIEETKLFAIGLNRVYVAKKA